MSQTNAVMKLCKRINGATNWELSHVSLKYSSRIAELRGDGINVQAVRQQLPNGRYTNTWRYYIKETE